MSVPRHCKLAPRIHLQLPTLPCVMKKVTKKVTTIVHRHAVGQKDVPILNTSSEERLSKSEKNGFCAEGQIRKDGAVRRSLRGRRRGRRRSAAFAAGDNKRRQSRGAFRHEHAQNSHHTVLPNT